VNRETRGPNAFVGSKSFLSEILNFSSVTLTLCKKRVSMLYSRDTQNSVFLNNCKPSPFVVFVVFSSIALRPTKGCHTVALHLH
jgi:hypothetical protein